MSRYSAKGHRYRKLCQWVRANFDPICWRCWQPIDETLASTHPMSYTVDHGIALANGGDPLDYSRARPMHRRCNAGKGAKRQVTPYPPPSRPW